MRVFVPRRRLLWLLPVLLLVGIAGFIGLGGLSPGAGEKPQIGQLFTNSVGGPCRV